MVFDINYSVVVTSAPDPAVVGIAKTVVLRC